MRISSLHSCRDESLSYQKWKCFLMRMVVAMEVSDICLFGRTVFKSSAAIKDNRDLSYVSYATSTSAFNQKC